MTCHHFDHVNLKELPSAAASHAKGCPECIKMGDNWVHLRECLICGHVGCCDSSKNKHATRHFHTSQHPVMRSVEPGERWGWCYVDQAMAQMP